MRILIDGYNVMYAGGLLHKRLAPDGLRKVRHRFLNDLTSWLDPVEAHFTTIVFDAKDAPEFVSTQTRHKGLTIIFAKTSESADEKIEELIGGHSLPRTLTVVSSDNRVRKAAERKRAKVVSADEYWVKLDDLKRKKAAAERFQKVPEPPPPDPEAIRWGIGQTAEETAYWQEVFGDVSRSPEAKEIESRDVAFPSDDDVDRIAREVEAEFRNGGRPRGLR